MLDATGSTGFTLQALGSTLQALPSPRYILYLYIGAFLSRKSHVLYYYMSITNFSATYLTSGCREDWRLILGIALRHRKQAMWLAPVTWKKWGSWLWISDAGSARRDDEAYFGMWPWQVPSLITPGGRCWETWWCRDTEQRTAQIQGWQIFCICISNAKSKSSTWGFLLRNQFAAVISTKSIE